MLDDVDARIASGRYPDQSVVFARQMRATVAQMCSNMSAEQRGHFMESFEKLLVDYPDSPKRSHAMRKIGFIHDEQGRKEQAREVLAELIARYPQSTAASLAEKRLQRLQ